MLWAGKTPAYAKPNFGTRSSQPYNRPLTPRADEAEQRVGLSKLDRGGSASAYGPQILNDRRATANNRDTDFRSRCWRSHAHHDLWAPGEYWSTCAG